jgi:lipoyl-dependent peroxiredoxin
MPKRTAEAVWNGPFKEGSGTMRMASGAYEGPYSAESRFEEGEGTNPEELLASAHAGCFSMALTLGLEKAGHEPQSVETEATVHINKAGEGFAIDRIDLVTRANVPGMSEEDFQQAAEGAKEGCPVSQLFKGGTAEITLDATLES